MGMDEGQAVMASYGSPSSLCSVNRRAHAVTPAAPPPGSGVTVDPWMRGAWLHRCPSVKRRLALARSLRAVGCERSGWSQLALNCCAVFFFAFVSSEVQQVP